MGRTYTNKAHKHFSYDVKDISQCNICKSSLKGNHGTNLKKHLIRNNHEFKEDYFVEVSSNKVKNIFQKERKGIQPHIDDMNTIKLKMTKKNLENSCVELVTVNGRPFSILNDSGFQNIINPIKHAIEDKNKQKFSLSPESIQKKVFEEADRIRKEIYEDIKNNMISMKIDAVTRLDRSFLGINIQYIKNTRITLRTLALKELKEIHTDEYIRRSIKNVCSSFNISLDQIYTITTDNGANMLKAVRMLSSEYRDYDEEISEENQRKDNENNNDNVYIETEESTEEDIEHTDLNSDLNILEEIEAVVENSNFPNNILTGIRYAAHTLQLAVHDALKKMETVSFLISKARNLVKKLRTQTFMYLISKQKFKKPTIDCPTRWCSTIDMLENLLLLKDYCEELAVTKFQNFVTLKDDEWKKIEEICAALRPSKICTKKLQSEQLTLSEFVGIWYETKLTTETIGTPFALLIVEQMKHREQKLLDNDIVLSAVFMDPRYKILLEETQIEKAKSHLKHVWTKLMTLNRNENLNVDGDGSSSNNSSETGSTYDEFENILKLKERQHHLINSRLTSRKSDLYFLRQIEHKLQIYDVEQKRLNRKSNVLQFWNEQKSNQPELYKLAMIVLSVPATQVSVERLFSGLKFILSPLRTNVKENILEDQLLVRASIIFSCKEKKNPEIGKRQLAEVTIVTNKDNIISKKLRR